MTHGVASNEHNLQTINNVVDTDAQSVYIVLKIVLQTTHRIS